MDNKIIFIHIPKTAGSSVLDIINTNVNYLYKGHAEKIIYITKYYFLNQPVIDYSELSPKSWFQNNLKSFAIIRNPYYRLISAYNYIIDPDLNKGPNASKYRNLLLKYENFSDFLKDLEYVQTQIVHFVPQYIFLCNEHDTIIVNKVIKFENLREELVSFDPIFEKLKHKNKSEEITSDVFLTKKNMKIIYNAYKKDFEIFNYSKEI